MADSKVEQMVFQWLSLVDVDMLTGLCEEFKIEVTADKAGKKQLLLKLIRRHLSSEDLENSADAGKALFDKLHEDLSENLGTMGIKSESKKMPALDLHEDNNDGKITFQRLREFKINGTIGNVGQKDTLSYISLSFQMKQGKESGYSSKEVCAAVIRSIKPGNSLRDYLESKGDVTEAALIQILRSHFTEKDSSSVFHELSNCVQLAGESEHEFCLRAMSLREKVARLSDEEECPFDDDLLRKRFFHSIFTGLKQNTIRMELQQILKECTFSDEDLLKEISLASSNEQERLSKMKTKTDVNQLTFESGNCEKKEKVKEPKENKLLLEISKLTAKVNELTSVKDEIHALKKQFSQSHNLNPQNYGVTDSDLSKSQNSGILANNEYRQRYSRRKNFYRCKNCEISDNSFCSHCFKCGSNSHKKYQCDQKN